MIPVMPRYLNKIAFEPITNLSRVIGKKLLLQLDNSCSAELHFHHRLLKNFLKQIWSLLLFEIYSCTKNPISLIFEQKL